MRITSFLFPLVAITLAQALPLFAEERHAMAPRVPADQLASARALANPLPASPETVERGGALYAGKGGCATCHGTAGRGDGPLAASLTPSPRNFHHRGFWRHRTEGELFWVIKHGVPGTAMIGFGGQLTDEEIWALIHYLRQLAGESGRDRMDGGPGPKASKGCGGPGGGAGCSAEGRRHRGPHE